MNDQCYECRIRKWCYLREPEEDWTCEHYKSEDDYVDFLDDFLDEDREYTKINYTKAMIQPVWDTTPSVCGSCSNNPKNGGSGICHCILGTPSIV